MSERENNVFKAMLGYSAERYEEMVEQMKKVASLNVELTAKEQDLLSVGYKNLIDARYASWKIISSIEQKVENERDRLQGAQEKLQMIKNYRGQVENEIRYICSDILQLLDQYLIPCSLTGKSDVVYYRMKGDYRRYLAEVATAGDRNDAAVKSLAAYITATDNATVHDLPPEDPIKLTLASNFAVFYSVIMKSPHQALELAQAAFDDAIDDIHNLSNQSFTDSFCVMELLKKNIDKCTQEIQDDGFFASIFQSFINSAPTFVFDAIKPLLLSEAYVQISQEIDSSIEKVSEDHRFPNSVSPLDMAIADARKKVRSLGYDPYKIKNYNHTVVGLFGMKMTNTWITGVSSFYRVGEITVGVDNLTITIGMQIGTQKILGASQWEVSFGSGMITRSGNIQFTIDHIKALFEISQSLDMRKRPEIKDLQLELGNIQVRCDGTGTLDYITEFLVNILPNLLRYQIMDALENPGKLRIQQMMNKIDVEKIIKEKVIEYEKKRMNMSMNFDFK